MRFAQATIYILRIEVPQSHCRGKNQPGCQLSVARPRKQELTRLIPLLCDLSHQIVVIAVRRPHEGWSFTDNAFECLFNLPHFVMDLFSFVTNYKTSLFSKGIEGEGYNVVAYSG